MKDFSIMDLCIKSVGYLLVFVLLFGFMSLMVAEVLKVLALAFTSPANGIALVLVLGILYVWRKEEIHAVFEGFWRKAKKV